MEEAFGTAVLAGAVRAGTPMVFAGLGELLYQRSGVVNLGLEGFMLVGALSAVWAQASFGSPALALLAASLTSAAFGVIHWYACVKLRTNQIATGLAFVILCHGLTALVGRGLVGRRIVVDLSWDVPWLSDIPFVGPVLFKQDLLVYLAILLTFATWGFLYRTRSGVLLRATGESAEFAATAGVPVLKVRLLAAITCGLLCGLGGAHLSLAYAGQWQEDMVSGRGWIALALVIFAMWKPVQLLFAAYLFGGLTSLNLYLQAAGIRSYPYVLDMMPFVITIAVLILTTSMKHRWQGQPADLGKPFRQQS